MIRRLLLIFGPFLCGMTLSLVGCSSETSREHIESVRESAHPHTAATGMDSFWLDHRSPKDRPVNHWEFYYKHCLQDDYKPYPDHIEYMCTGPF